MKKPKGIIERELDKIIERVQNEEFDIQKFVNYRKVLRNNYFKSLSLYRKSRVCVVPNCVKNSITKSHTISRTSTLSNIASNKHVYTPEFDTQGTSPLIKMEKIGLKNASIFPGYCEQHENIFQTYERDSKIDTAKKALLQTYRSICRERVIREIEIEISKKMENSYREKLENEALIALKKDLSKSSISVKLNNIHIEGGDYILFQLNKSISYLSDVNSRLVEIEHLVYHQIFENSVNDELLGKVLNFDIKFPIALSGFVIQKYSDQGVSKTAIIILNVIPTEKSTYLVCFASEKDKTIFNSYTEFFFSDPFNLLKMVESFMINGSDHWYINPKYWDNMSSTKKNKILFDILNTQDSFLDEYSISIFDDIRKKVLEVFLNNTKHRQLTSVESELVIKEQEKLNRTDFEFTFDEKEVINRITTKFFDKGLL
jgi:hypothetical protein